MVSFISVGVDVRYFIACSFLVLECSFDSLVNFSELSIFDFLELSIFNIFTLNTVIDEVDRGLGH